MENKVGDPAEQGLSGEHREDLQMQIQHQFSARKQYFNGNGHSVGLEKHIFEQEEHAAASADTKGTRPTLKK